MDSNSMHATLHTYLHHARCIHSDLATPMMSVSSHARVLPWGSHLHREDRNSPGLHPKMAGQAMADFPAENDFNDGGSSFSDGSETDDILMAAEMAF